MGVSYSTSTETESDVWVPSMLYGTRSVAVEARAKEVKHILPPFISSHRVRGPSMSELSEMMRRSPAVAGRNRKQPVEILFQPELNSISRLRCPIKLIALD